ncbi:MAG TPA: inositol monophosphatase family protein, partial [Candidatus Eremiobacteraceae bacterium]|nr:inositol monophosphatase family protein [Candidatus Eremiobacteraceae bacterium]
MDRRLHMAQRAARTAGTLLREMLGTHMQVRAKDVRSNLVTEADTRSEALIRTMIAEEFPDDAVLGEEGGATRGSGAGHWIVDPLDGTTNFAHGYRCFSVSIACEFDGHVQVGAVFDPMADEMYLAQRGKGATCNGNALAVSAVSDLCDALLVTGFPPLRADGGIANLPMMEKFMHRAQAIRRDGSAALDLCYVAAGRFDGFWEAGLHAWDIAAGALIVDEAGGRVTDYSGNQLRLDGG